MDARFRPFNQTLEQEEAWKDSVGERQFRSRFSPTGSGIKEAYARGKLTLSDLKERHLQAAWRISRMHTLAKMQLNPEEQLSVLPTEAWLEVMPDASKVNRSATAQQIVEDWSGLGLQPTVENIDEFVIALARTARMLLIPRTSLYTLDDTRTCLKYYPHPDEIAHYEHVFCLELSEKLLGSGPTGVVRHLVCEAGFLKMEAQSYVPLIKAAAIEDVIVDQVADQRLMVARTESLLGRAQDSLDLKTELNGLKHLATVQGLGKVESTNQFDDFANVIRELAEAERNERLSIGAKTRVLDVARSNDSGDSSS